MAEVSEEGVHRVGHSGIGPECPIWCLGVRTVGDLLNLLVEAGRPSGLHAVFADAVAGVPHEHERVTLGCPMKCLGLSARVLGALHNDRGRTVTVGDVLGLLRSRELAEVRHMGPRRVDEVRTALIAAGFSVPAHL